MPTQGAAVSAVKCWSLLVLCNSIVSGSIHSFQVVWFVADNINRRQDDHCSHVCIDKSEVNITGIRGREVGSWQFFGWVKLRKAS